MIQELKATEIEIINEDEIRELKNFDVGEIKYKKLLQLTCDKVKCFLHPAQLL